MPKGIPNNSNIPNCKLPQAVSASIKAHKNKKAPTNKSIKIMEFLHDQLDCKVNFNNIDELAETFNISSKQVNGDLYIALLNLDKDTLKKNIEDGEIWKAFYKIMYRVNIYLPKELQMSYKCFSTVTSCESTDDILREFLLFIIGKINEIEDYMTRKYYNNGKINHLEILKRKFKSSWGDNSKSLEIKETSSDGDRSITINFIT